MSSEGPTNGTFTGEWDATSFIVVICSGLAGYNALELLLLIFTTFNVYQGLYFWSLLVSTFGILPYFVGLCIFYFGFTVRLPGYIINNLGWIAMVTGQSFVLYSRLGVVLGQSYERLLQFVKWMIIIDGVVFHVSTAVVTFGTHYAPHPAGFARGYYYIEKIQMTGFCLQEFIISGIYIWKTIDILKTGEKKQAHRIMIQLFVINFIIIVLDIGLLVLEYLNLFVIEVSFKELAYSIKLKLEFAILSKLVEFTNTGRRRYSNFFGDTTGFLDSSGRLQSVATADQTHSSVAARSDSRPQWIHDLEQEDSKQADEEKATTQQYEFLSTAPIANGNVVRNRGFPSGNMADHNFDSISPVEGSVHDRSDPDVMYAEAMRTISKC